MFFGCLCIYACDRDRILKVR